MQEKIIYQTGFPKIFNVWNIVKIYLGLSYGFPNFFTGENMSFKMFVGIFFVYIFIKGILGIIENMTAQYQLTEKQFIVDVGVVSKIYLEIDLSSIQGVYVEQTLLGRLFNYGDVYIATPSGTTNYCVKNPMELKRQINLIKEKTSEK